MKLRKLKILNVLAVLILIVVIFWTANAQAAGSETPEWQNWIAIGAYTGFVVIAMGFFMHWRLTVTSLHQVDLENQIKEQAKELKAQGEITRQIEQDAQAATNLLRDAIENITEGFAVYGLEDRLVICNDNYREIYSRVADILVPGISFGELVDEDIKRSKIPGDQIAEMKKALLDQHNQCTGEPLIRQAQDGRWIQSTDYRTSEGGLVGIRSDVTAYKDAEAELREKMENLEVFNKVAVGRELRMIELKKEINALFEKSGQAEKYDIVE